MSTFRKSGMSPLAPEGSGLKRKRFRAPNARLANGGYDLASVGVDSAIRVERQQIIGKSLQAQQKCSQADK